MGINFNYDSYQKLLEDNDVEIVAIGDYYGIRGQRVIEALEHGKHGGTINGIAIHGIDLIRYITGKNLSKVDCAKTWNAFATQEPRFEDSAQFMVDMEGMALNADVSYAAPKFDGILPTYWNFTLWGEKGMLNFKLCDNEIHIYKNKKEIITMPDRKIDYLCDFVKEINGENPKYINTIDMLASQRQVLTIQKAAENQKGC